MASLDLLVLDVDAWERLAQDPAPFARERRLTLGTGGDLLRQVGEQTAALLRTTGATTPWGGYLAVDREREQIVGTCGFKAPPDAEGVVELAYFTFPEFEGKGYATAMAVGLLARAVGRSDVQRVRAHTLPERNASTRILEKLGFRFLGPVIDPEDGPVWRWEK